MILKVIKNSLIVIILVLQLLVCTKTGYAQSSLFYDYYNSENGLSQNSVYSITQTNDGFMWFGTQEGINRFDGKYFTKVNENYDKRNQNEMDYGEFSKTINVLYHDNRDWVWTGTAKEISIYNRFTNKFFTPGYIYENFKMPPDANITGITEIRQMIWVLTQNKGLYCYDLQKKKMNEYSWKNNMPKKLLCIQQDKYGHIWICSEKEIFKLTNNTFVPQEKINSYIGSAGITNMLIINNELWFITGKRKICYLNIDEGEKAVLKYFLKEYHGKTIITDPNLLHQSSHNILWIGSRSDGLLKVNLQNHTFESLSDNDKQSLNTRFILSFFTDRQKITWVGLSGGIFKFDYKDTKIELWRARTNDRQIATDNHIFSIFSRNDNDFYMGTLNGGLLHLNVRSQEYNYYLPTNIGSSLSDSKNIYEVIEGENNLLWMATMGGLYSFNTLTKQFIEYKDFEDEQTLQLCALIKLKNTNKILLGGYNGGLRLFNMDTKRFEKVPDVKHYLDDTKLRVRYLKEFEGGDIFMSTETNCLVKYNYLTGVFTPYPQFKKFCGASRYFYFDSQFLWIATDDGLIQADKKTKATIRYWTTKNGLANDYIYTVVPDQYGRIWVSSNGGLSMLDYKNGTCRNFTLSDNLQDLEFNTASCYTDQEKNLWFGGINGLNKVQPNITKPDTFSPKPMITQINVMNAPYETDTAVAYISKIILPYNKNFISFQFQTPNYSQTDKIIYKYILEGVDTGWINTGNKNFLNYTQLRPGKYTFRIKSANAGDIWCAQDTAIDIIITPPWWQTWWFRIFAIISIGTVLVYIISNRIKTIRKQERLKYKIIETEMKSLRAQMNPHFIFNSLNSINGFIIENKTHLASDYLTKFARLVRLILENSKNETITLEKEIETLRLYLLMESLRFENKFEYIIQVQENIETEDIDLPPLIIQPYVENAIWHGLLHKNSRGKVTINISKTNDTLLIEITDDGIGREKSAINQKIRPHTGKSYGMEITKQRILALNTENNIQINDILDEANNIAGTKVILQLFLNTTS